MKVPVDVARLHCEERGDRQRDSFSTIPSSAPVAVLIPDNGDTPEAVDVTNAWKRSVIEASIDSYYERKSA